ncbi:MAG TPA: hypothetical protein VMD91_00460 [Candidatus Sulfotelmatobacter sp.]|nr:hypothetical protein [Candidatus Sulfotelmatobacter sp.]
MIARFRRPVALAAALLASLALPLAVSAQPGAATHYLLRTRETIENHAGEFDGVLSMTVFPNGIIQGTYRLADEGNIQAVSGSVQGDKLWLDIGGAARTEEITGTFRDGVIKATVLRPGIDITYFTSAGPSTHI